MKLKTHHVPGWWTLSLRAFVVIIGLVAAAGVASAQESKPAEKATTNAEGKEDAERPVFAVGLEPATLLFKQVVELFGPRGMKVPDTTAPVVGAVPRLRRSPHDCDRKAAPCPNWLARSALRLPHSWFDVAGAGANAANSRTSRPRGIQLPTSAFRGEFG